MKKKESVPKVIRLSNISKSYTIHHEKPTLIEKVVKGREEKFNALNCINLTIRKGETIGIIGPNGSGKTTLLKIIAGITTPTSGKIESDGNIISLIDLEAGFHPDLNGEQNIYLNGMLLGIKKSTISQRLHQVIEFADIGRFIDAPLFTYSEGMKLRLGFSVIVLSKPQVLIFDESLVVGDAAFQKKTMRKIKEFNKNGTTIIMVSHSLDFVKNHCKRIIAMKNGRIVYDGKSNLITNSVKY